MSELTELSMRSSLGKSSTAGFLYSWILFSARITRSDTGVTEGYRVMEGYRGHGLIQGTWNDTWVLGRCGGQGLIQGTWCDTGVMGRCGGQGAIQGSWSDTGYMV